MINQLIVVSAPSEEWLTFFYVWLQQQLDAEYNTSDQMAVLDINTDTQKYVTLKLLDLSNDE